MILSIVLLFIILLFLYLKTKNLALILKISGSFVFVYMAIWAFFKNPTNPNYFILVFIGLIFSFLGDVFLVLKSKTDNGFDKIFFLGLASFIITHIFYSLAFISLGSLNIYTLICTILTFFIFMKFFKSLKNFSFKSMAIPCYIYILAISFMLCNALSLISCNLNKTALLFLTIGALLFFISDFIISFILFFDNCPKFLGIINLITYYLGQILIALSIYYI